MEFLVLVGAITVIFGGLYILGGIDKFIYKSKKQSRTKQIWEKIGDDAVYLGGYDPEENHCTEEEYRKYLLEEYKDDIKHKVKEINKIK